MAAAISDLALLLDAPVFAMTSKPPPKHVYHVAVRNPPEDRQLTDEEWGRVAQEMMHAAGIARHGQERACRWVAIRHADDHIHIVATRAREDGRQPNLRQDIVRMHAAARNFEVEFGLRRLVDGDHTARRWPKTGETEKAVRRGLGEPVRETLQRTVREAAAAAASEEEFFARLTAAGVRVNRRVAPDGNVTGYSVALPGDRDQGQQPVFFSGARLAPDLSLPRVRERWAIAVSVPTVAPAQMWQEAERRVRAAADHLGAGGLHEGAGDVAALGDLIVVAAVASPHLVRGQLRDAAFEYERASRAPGDRRLEGQARSLYRESAYLVSRSAAVAGRADTVAALGFLVALATAVEAAQRWHQAQQHRAQAEASGKAGRLLREAVEVTAGARAAREYRAGRRPAAGRPPRAGRAVAVSGERPMAGVVQEALPGHARAILADPAWPALRTRLVAVAETGEDPAEVLAAVAARRELGSADSVAEVLTWRLYGWSRERGAPTSTTGKSPSPTSTGGTSGPRKTGAPGPRRPPGDEQRKGPRRAR
ncbi:mobilization protein [Streptomyces bacillaris]|uniref:relaxase/mobilization nuclease domain-containing protein n=1 Tax=Streptomyces bacillaris TaxID=68179 RepID=UPI00345F3B52